MSNKSEFSEIEAVNYINTVVLERKRYRTQWAKFFRDGLKYKHPYLINADAFQNINDELDVLDG